MIRTKEPGVYAVQWEVNDLPTGQYIKDKSNGYFGWVVKHLKHDRVKIRVQSLLNVTVVGNQILHRMIRLSEETFVVVDRVTIEPVGGMIVIE